MPVYGTAAVRTFFFFKRGFLIYVRFHFFKLATSRLSATLLAVPVML